MNRKTQPEASGAPAASPEGGPGAATADNGCPNPAGSGPKDTVPRQQRVGGRPGAGDAGRADASPDTSPPVGGSPETPVAATGNATSGAGPGIGRNGRAIARRTGVAAPAAPPAAGEGVPAAAAAGGTAVEDADGTARGRRSRRVALALALGCGVALAAVATLFVIDAVTGEGKAPDRGSAGYDARPGAAERSTGAAQGAGPVLRAMALTATAVGYAPGVTGAGPAGRSAFAKARQDGRRYALAAWDASGRPARDDALYGALLRAGAAYRDGVTTHFGMAPRGEVLVADVAPEGHKLAVLTREKGAASARMQVLAFGGDGTTPKWSTVGPAVDPASAFAISDCGGMVAFAEPDGHREVWNMMGAQPVKVFESNGDGVDRAAGERQFLDFGNDTHRVLYAHGPLDALRGEVVAVHQPVPVVEGDVAFPQGREVDEVRLDGSKPTAVTLTADTSDTSGRFLSRYGDRVTAPPVGAPGRTRIDASQRYGVELSGPAHDVYAVRVTLPLLGRVYEAVLPSGSRAADVATNGTLVVPVREDGRTLRLIIVTDEALTVVDATRVDHTRREERPALAELVAEACGASPQPLTAHDLSALPTDERGAAAAARPCA